MQELKKTAIFAVVGAVVLTFANLVAYRDAVVYDQESLSTIESAIAAYEQQESDYIGYKSRY